jgi:hypothetical protein
MAERSFLKDWVVEALKELGGSASLLDVVKQVWKSHKADLTASGEWELV